MIRTGPGLGGLSRHLGTVLVVLVASSSGWAKGGVYDSTKHGDALNGAARLPAEPRGDCSQCHDQHASRDGTSTAGPFSYLLFAANDNNLCFTCHTAVGLDTSFQGSVLYTQSTHALSPSMVWPGPPQRPSNDWGKCINCHDPHGVRDNGTLIPSLLIRREETSCLTCHDGSPALRDVNSQFQKGFRHPTTTVAGKHSAQEGGNPTQFGWNPNNRHAECPDCHNPHTLKTSSPPPTAPNAKGVLYNVSRIRVTNGGAGTVPLYSFIPASDLSFPNEYEVCFKCHSSWTTLPVGQSDLAVLLNTNNPSFHPVEGVGKNSNISPLAFVSGWSESSQTYCSDCHASDDPNVRGPHGSVYRYILKKPYTAASAFRTMSSGELCFDCHSFDTYGNASSGTTTQSYSRFNMPAGRGHAFHVDQRQVPCYACHATHGSTTLPLLLVIGRTPGLNSYTQTVNGGTCSPTCHATRSYSINYPR